MAELPDVYKLSQQLAALLDEVVVIAGRHARLHLCPNTGNRYRNENMAFLNLAKSGRAPLKRLLIARTTNVVYTTPAGRSHRARGRGGASAKAAAVTGSERGDNRGPDGG